jgi:hypothetical protein
MELVSVMGGETRLLRMGLVPDKGLLVSICLTIMILNLSYKVKYMYHELYMH